MQAVLAAPMWLKDFDDGDASQRALLGGKGANLAEMRRIGIPVPPGFTITTEACLRWQTDGDAFLDGEVMPEVDAALVRLGELTGRHVGDATDPLLLSVRSGAAVSMPGMMDTVLNLGLNATTEAAMIARTGDERFVLDSHRRFTQMFAEVVLGVDHHGFEQVLTAARTAAGVMHDGQLSTEALRGILHDFRAHVAATGQPFPDDPRTQLRGAIRAVFASWETPRARTYRRLNGIPDDLGTAVNVQAMVFGNTGPASCSGVYFSRDPAKGTPRLYGEFLQNAQGEDVVAGIRTPHPLEELDDDFPGAYAALEGHARTLEAHYGDMQDMEFTIEDGTLWMLQTRTGKRTGLAALRILCDLVAEGATTPREAIGLISAEQADHLFHPRFGAKQIDAAVADGRLWATGLPAGPGAACGRVALSADAAERMAADGPVILVREETSADDVAGMAAAVGVVTCRGGMTSHAAVVARGMGLACVVGCAEIVVDEGAGTLIAGDVSIAEGDWLSVTGTSGRVFVGRMEPKPSEIVAGLVHGEKKARKAATTKRWQQLSSWIDEVPRMGVRANADTPTDAAAARALGAAGIGLCRTEHMFFGAERLLHVRRLILAESAEDETAALAHLLEHQRGDFSGILGAMDGLPVTIRLLDPPLHEFLPVHEAEFAAVAAELGVSVDRIHARVRALAESNPMLGHRGCRLSITHPNIIRMQARAIAEATRAVRAAGVDARPEIMVPLVAIDAELSTVRAVIEDEWAAVAAEAEGDLPQPPIGTMIELPRSALTADEIAPHADFFSFGTNDLTQTTWGISRDDAASFLVPYLEQRIVAADPFVALDQSGVGKLVRIGVELGRGVKNGLKVGICGEHGGEPSSIRFCHEVGLDYVSCSPYRVAIARLVAAQAALAE